MAREAKVWPKDHHHTYWLGFVCTVTIQFRSNGYNKRLWLFTLQEKHYVPLRSWPFRSWGRPRDALDNTVSVHTHTPPVLHVMWADYRIHPMRHLCRVGCSCLDHMREPAVCKPCDSICRRKPNTGKRCQCTVFVESVRPKYLQFFLCDISCRWRRKSTLIACPCYSVSP